MNIYDVDDEDNFYMWLMGFEQSCMEEVDLMFFCEIFCCFRFCCVWLSFLLLMMRRFGCWSVNVICNVECLEDMVGALVPVFVLVADVVE